MSKCVHYFGFIKRQSSFFVLWDSSLLPSSNSWFVLKSIWTVWHLIGVQLPLRTFLRCHPKYVSSSSPNPVLLWPTNVLDSSCIHLFFFLDSRLLFVKTRSRRLFQWVCFLSPLHHPRPDYLETPSTRPSSSLKYIVRFENNYHFVLFEWRRFLSGNYFPASSDRDLF